MTLDEYRILHSRLIEKYQWIEADLEELCAAVSHAPFHKALREIERDSIGGVVREIRQMEEKQNITVLSREEYEALDMIRERRNFWTHQCYIQKRDENTGVPQNADILSPDLQRAEDTLHWLRKVRDMWMGQDLN